MYTLLRTQINIGQNRQLQELRECAGRAEIVSERGGLGVRQEMHPRSRQDRNQVREVSGKVHEHTGLADQIDTTDGSPCRARCQRTPCGKADLIFRQLRTC